MITYDWGVSPFFGWGVYGLNLALELTRRGLEARTFGEVDLTGLDVLRSKLLEPFARRSSRREPRALMKSLGNDLITGAESSAPIGVAFFENPLSAKGVERGRTYELIVAGSSWNEQLLRDTGLNHVHTILQGIDTSLFHPAPKRGLYPDRFLIFSGGKAEPRKGQDLVVKAFRIFAARHPEAMLVTAWHSPWSGLSEGMDLDLSSVAAQVIDVGALPNGQMAPVYRECDVAVFPNRAEGGTNLVAMECLACGVPALLSANSGHLDLLSRTRNAHALTQQRQNPAYATWNDSDVDEIVAGLELVHAGAWRATEPRPLAELTWSNTVEQLLEAIEPFGLF